MPKKREVLLGYQNARWASKDVHSFLTVKKAAELMEKEYYSKLTYLHFCWRYKQTANKFQDSIPEEVLAIS